MAASSVSLSVDPTPASIAATQEPATVTGLIDVTPDELHALLQAGDAVVIDVREPDEYAIERIEGALLMPLSMFDASKFPRVFDRTVVLMCAIGKRSRAAALQMQKAGFDPVHHLDGGLKAWKAIGLEVEA